MRGTTPTHQKKCLFSTDIQVQISSFSDKHIAKYSKLCQHVFKVTNCFSFKKLLLLYGETEGKCSTLRCQSLKALILKKRKQFLTVCACVWVLSFCFSFVDCYFSSTFRMSRVFICGAPYTEVSQLSPRRNIRKTKQPTTVNFTLYRETNGQVMDNIFRSL